MSARNFLVRGLLAGLLAGFATFAVAYLVGEPHVQTAIDIEESAAAPAPASSTQPQGATASPVLVQTHSGGAEDEGTVVSRHNQRTWGLLTGTLGLGTALGGIVALVSAGLVGRLGRLDPGQITAFTALAGFVAVALVPFLKYPASPPAVGNPDTIGGRTGLFFLYLLISVLAAVAATLLARHLWRDRGAYLAVVAGIGLYLLVVVLAGALLPTVNEIGDFPADTLWYFHRASIITQATTWGVIGVALAGMVNRLHRQTTTTAERRALAASL